MKIFTISLLVLLCFGASAEEILIQGTLFKKNDKWNVFVESDQTSIKKGVFELNNIPDSYRTSLIEKAFVKIVGQIEKCNSAQKCLAVKKIDLANPDPLKGKR